MHPKFAQVRRVLGLPKKHKQHQFLPPSNSVNFKQTTTHFNKKIQEISKELSDSGYNFVNLT